ncbi:MAG: energy transducer TonB [Spirochaetaceae bacterium]|nr:MAG: energy transducer TonB [Spirochaetaceae bacterium]
MMRMWRGGKTENQHLVWAVVVSLVLHAGIVVAVSLYTPADAPSAGDGRLLITALEFGTGAAGTESTSADNGAPPRAEPEQEASPDSVARAEPRPETVEAAEVDQAAEANEAAESEEPTLPRSQPDSSAPSEHVELPELSPVAESGGVTSDRPGDTSNGADGRSAESVTGGVPDGSPEADRPPRIELPRPLAEISPEYPVQARRRGMEGVVVIRVTISPSGEPVDTTIVSPSAHAQLNEAAISAVRAARFRPGTIDESPAEMSVSIRIVFEVS